MAQLSRKKSILQFVVNFWDDWLSQYSKMISMDYDGINARPMSAT